MQRQCKDNTKTMHRQAKDNGKCNTTFSFIHTAPITAKTMERQWSICTLVLVVVAEVRGSAGLFFSAESPLRAFAGVFY